MVAFFRAFNEIVVNYMWIWPGHKSNVKKVCNNSPSQKGERGVGMFILVEGQLLHK